MTNSQRLAAVRQKLQAWFADQRSDQPWEVRESILIRDGFYCGRRFDFADHRAVWFVEEDQVKVYHRDGALVDSFQGSEELRRPTLHRPQPDDQPAVEQQPQTSQQPPARRAA